MTVAPPETINLIWANFENEGKGDKKLWRDFYTLVRSLEPHLFGRAEMQGAANNGKAGLLAAEKALTPPEQPLLRPRGWLGPPAVSDNRTGIFTRPDVFEPVNEWEHGTPWGIPPTNLTIRLVQYPGDPDCRREICVAAAHHHYASPLARRLEADELTKLADKRDMRDRTKDCPNGRPREAIVFYDANSYPADSLDGDLQPPDLSKIPDLRHQVHRMVKGPGSTFIPDCESDRTLRRAGMEDIARHLAVTKEDDRYLARTTAGYPDQGGPGRIDRVHATDGILAAVEDLEVIDLSGLSDHDAVHVKLSRRRLVESLTPTG
ncbi:hypothetical protein [Streptomyces sp. NBC_01262]|uniref:hypothetical protein n=1 Tax=Streptomyces sp. NBC_01262 TaxID=2903803 RepID=UPI002E33628A|nr:hypothetical protein [Streptomyces sp. NBC_01262]